MGFKLTPKDLELIADLHPSIRAVILETAHRSPFRFRVIEGRRTLTRQKKLLASGASTTLNSRHLTGHAIDIVPYFDSDEDGDIDGDDLYAWPLYYRLAPIVKAVAKEYGIALEWGGDWRTFKDGPHWQLAWAKHPADEKFDGTVRLPSQPGPVKTDPRTGGRTEQDRNKTIAAGGTIAGISLGADPLLNIVNAIQSQRGVIDTGDIAQIAVSVGLVAAVCFFAYRR
jgi:peptidoglycan L-alanyl-D-glutamate endopeptidase CwlK